ncbi:MAG: hypothetical protein HN731_10810 [Rhodospirillaceae bacterium]|jgi:hypothetical protein|nr:hypothetical protein [Rhodospirillaceae bacterium]
MENATQFLAWAFEIPYLITYNRLHGCDHFKIVRADDDYKNTYADDPKFWVILSEAVEEYESPMSYIETLLIAMTPPQAAIAALRQNSPADQQLTA